MKTRSPAERHARISEIAHSIWESEGRPSGQSLRHWCMAEKLVLAEERHAAQRNEKQHAGKKSTE
ncbi:DUF2934 domain-containing protein [Dyella monticola]|uniref:DUF2934 domain-containing protein n=1 Tax=Dyella monticola TaxID=1927958 RepID=A0A370WTL3_9GAMM|nr:DUF2934 domain-containing protein [Dyella monticola]RDS79499.1 DUF2934 domain-containing protein [Dyella monticola]